MALLAGGLIFASPSHERASAQSLTSAPTMSPGASPCPSASIFNPVIPVGPTMLPGMPNPTMPPMPSSGGGNGAVPAPPSTGSAVPGLTQSVSQPTPGPISTASAAPCSGGLPPQLYQAALSFAGTSTAWAGTQCNDGTLVSSPEPSVPGTDWYGNCACAASVQRIFQMATGQTIGTWSVDSWYGFATSNAYGGTIIPDAIAVPGDVIIWYSSPSYAASSEAHIGFCASVGCDVTMSNSSSKAEFAPSDSNINLGGYYNYHIIWDPQHVP